MNEQVLQRCRSLLHPPGGACGAVWSRIVQRSFASESSLQSFRSALAPSPSLRQRIWLRIEDRIAPVKAVNFLAILRSSVQPRLVPSPALAAEFIAIRRTPFQWLKWTAAVAIVALVVRSSPFLFFASQSAAGSTVILLPLWGQVDLLVGDVWEPVTTELQLTEAFRLRTRDGEATIVLHDDGVIRLAPLTSIAVRDLLDRPQSSGVPTFVLEQGRVWVQGLVPSTVGGIVAAMPSGSAEVHEGSMSIQLDSLVDVAVWDRRAKVTHEEQTLPLLSGERMQLWNGNVPTVRRIVSREYLGDWVAQNLDRDAVHRRDIAQLQRERRASLAGILPTSPLYSVKRAAEAVDIFLTFSEEERVRKKLSQAETRLNEAAALINDEGRAAAAQPLAEYKETLLEVASGSGGSVHSLLEQQVSDNAAAFSAVLPDDDGYLLKQVVLEAGAALPVTSVSAHDLREVMFLDSLVLLRDLAKGDPSRARATFDAIRSTLVLLNGGDEGVPPAARREALSLLSQVALMLQANSERTPDEQVLLEEVVVYLPVSAPVQGALTEAEIDQMVAGIHQRVFGTYKMPKSRLNQLFAELQALHGSPDEGRILRRVYRDFPEYSQLTRYIFSTIQRLRVQRIGERGEVAL